MNNTYISTPIYYVNSAPHIGHAYTNIIAECLAIWNKNKGCDTYLLTGTDEHGQKIEASASASSMTVKEFIDHYSAAFKDLADKLKMPYNQFIRTSEDRHKKIVQIIWTQLQEAGHIYLGKYSGWYAIRDEAFYKEDELIDGKAPTGADVVWQEEESYFFRLSNFTKPLLEFYKSHPGFIMPHNRYSEVINFVESGLDDLSISRTNFTHGINVPGDEKHVIYVWIDALANYISALDYPDGELYKKFWINGDTTHVIGKDIVRFHAIYWPAILMALGVPLPTRLLVHGWWLNEGQKISKSLGNVIDPIGLIDKYGIDYVKYFFLAEVGMGNDGNYSDERFRIKINTDLVNNIGNLLSRVTNMIENYLGGSVNGQLNNDFDEKIVVFISQYSKLMNDYKFSNAANEICDFATSINQYIDNVSPWKLFKDDSRTDRLSIINSCLYNSLQAIIEIFKALRPFIPEKSSEILSILDICLAGNIRKINMFEKLQTQLS